MFELLKECGTYLGDGLMDDETYNRVESIKETIKELSKKIEGEL